MRRWGTLLLGAALLGAAPARAAADDATPCRVDVSVEPATAYVGQQVVYRVRVLRRETVRDVRWLRALSFPSLRAEWLPGRLADPRITGIGDAYLVSEDRRALFPVRAGAIAIPPASLGCRLASGEEREIEVPGAALTAVPLPAEGRPPGDAGVVGPVQIRAHLSTRRARLGESLALAVILVGEANLWAAPPPLDPAQPGLDAYPRPPELMLEPGERLRVRRTFVWELVPRRTGRLALPAPRVSWFDPASGRYAVAEGPVLSVDVAPEEARVPAAPSAAAPPPAPAETPSRLRRLASGWAVAIALAGAALAALALARAADRRRAPLRAAAPGLADAERASAGGDREAAARALSAALRAALAVRVPGADALAPEELAARAAACPPVAAAAALLARLDRARFASGALHEEPLPSVDEVRAAIRALAGRGV